MVKKIILENYMSHIRTELELADGLTVLVGPNNCGKSAVVEAIRTVCENSGKDFMVRHGQKQCRVLIETDDGHTIEWKRDKSVVSYTIDGRDVHRLGGGVPDDLHEMLRLPRIKSPDGDDQFDIHIASQKSPLFLLERSGRELAMFFASSSDASLVMEMQRRHKQRWTERKRDRLQLESQQQECKQRIESLEAVPSVDEKLRLAEAMHEDIQGNETAANRLCIDLDTLQTQINTAVKAEDRFTALKPLPAPLVLSETLPLEKLLHDIESAERAVTRGNELCSQLTNLIAPPELADAASLETACLQLQRRYLEVSAGFGRVLALQTLIEPPALSDTGALDRVCNAIDRQVLELVRLRSGVDHLSRLLTPPEMADPAKLNELAAEFTKTLMLVSRIEARLKLTMAIAEPPELSDPLPLVSFIEGYGNSIEAVKVRSSEMEAACIAIETVMDSIRQWATANPTCPVCGGAVKADDLVAVGGHEHA